MRSSLRPLPRACWHTKNLITGCDIGHYNCAHGHHRAVANLSMIADASAKAEEHVVTNRRAATNDYARTDDREVTDLDVMFDDCPGANQTLGAKNGSGLYDRSCHHDCSFV